MDINTTILLVVIVLAVVALVGLWRFGQSGRAKISGPGGMGVDVRGSNEVTPAVRITDSESQAGGALADDKTGRGATIERTKVKDDLIASSSPTHQDTDPKA